MHPNTTTLFPEIPPAVTSSAPCLDAPGLPAQGDFLLTRYAPIVRVHGQPRFVAHLPPGMMRWRDNGGVMPFWSVTAFDAFIACLRDHGYRVTFPSLCVASVLPPVRGAVS